MRIDKIEIFHVALPVKQETRLVLHDRPVERVNTVLVRLLSDGVSGWGEAAPGLLPIGQSEWAGSVFRCVADCLGPALLEKVSCDTAEQLTTILAPFQGNRFAKAALDMAWWDLKSRLAQKPLHVALDAPRVAVNVGMSFDRMESPDQLVQAMKTAYDAGFSRVELKMRPGWDLSVLNYVRQELPAARLHVDIEGALTLAHTDLLYRFDDFMLDMVEQPLAAEDLVGHAMLQEAIRTPICLDESITTPALADIALDLKCCRRINVSPDKLGGISPALDVCGKAKRDDIACWVGMRPQSAIGTRASLALAAKVGGHPTQYFPSVEILEADLAPPLIPTLQCGEDGELMRVSLWDEPGLGVEPAGETLIRYCVKQAELRLT